MHLLDRALTSTPKRAPARYTIGPKEARVLRTLTTYYYLTPALLCKALYKPGSLSHAREILAELAKHGYARRLFLARESEFGRAPSVYTLDAKGRRYLQRHGVEVKGRFRPSEEDERDHYTLKHTLACNEFYIAVAKLCEATPGLELGMLEHELSLKRRPARVQTTRVTHDGLREREEITVIPDGYLDLHAPAHKTRQPILLEIDHSGSMEEKRWRRRVRGLAAWITGGGFAERYGTDAATVAVVALKGEGRRDRLAAWTYRELVAQGLQAEAYRFLFTALDPSTADPGGLLVRPTWYEVSEDASSQQPVALIDLAELTGGQSL